MARLSRVSSGGTLGLTFIGTFFLLPPRAKGQLQECPLANTHKSCALLTDRANPVALSTIQMYSGESVTVSFLSVPDSEVASIETSGPNNEKWHCCEHDEHEVVNRP
jgi:hypothetical protein